MSRDERLTRIELINPALFESGWTDVLIREEKTPGGVDIIDGKPRKRKGRTDYLLCLPILEGKPPLPIAVLEAKAEDKLPSLGIQQAKDYKKKFNVPFIFSSNGHLFAEYADDTGLIRDALPLSAFPSPEELKKRYEKIINFSLDSEQAKPLLMPYKGGDAAATIFRMRLSGRLWRKWSGEKRGSCFLWPPEPEKPLSPPSCSINWPKRVS